MNKYMKLRQEDSSFISRNEKKTFISTKTCFISRNVQKRLFPQKFTSSHSE